MSNQPMNRRQLLKSLGAGAGVMMLAACAPAAAPSLGTASAIAGVGRTPSMWTDAPTLAHPAASAPSSIAPLRRVSRPITTASPGCSPAPNARPMAIASSGVRSRFATPRTPSVPKSFRAGGVAFTAPG